MYLSNWKTKKPTNIYGTETDDKGKANLWLEGNKLD